MQAGSQWKGLCASLVVGCLGICSAAWAGPARAGAEEPIAYIGHGAFFEASGRQITPTQQFVAEAQAWYRADLSRRLGEDKAFDFSAFERDLFDGVPAQGQARLVFEQRALEWLYANSARQKDDDRTLGKLRALDFALTFDLRERLDTKDVGQGVPFVLPPPLAKKLAGVRALQAQGGAGVKTATLNSGIAYTNECIAAGVPIPPSIGVMDPAGLAGWKSQGFIPQALQFIVGTPAELRTYRSTSPLGMCYALPRYSNNAMTTVALDGVICLSEVTSKVCIWDNQMSGTTFSFAAGATIPIGAPNLGVDALGRYQAGGNELLGGQGGICTDCHAGENPFITHPKANLGAYLWENLWQALYLPEVFPEIRAQVRLRMRDERVLAGVAVGADAALPAEQFVAAGLVAAQRIDAEIRRADRYLRAGRERERRAGHLVVPDTNLRRHEHAGTRGHRGTRARRRLAAACARRLVVRPHARAARDAPRRAEP
ncbi:MAG TPA: hypothetical protein VM847_18740, partial [Tahibacter sp.]|nr:hypothetical protein [Tahibacter sp.]